MNDERRLDLSLLERALARLQQALADYHAHPEIESLRDSVVIRFVFTYELFLQVVYRYVELEHRKLTPESELTKSRVIRRANDLGVLQVEWEQFVSYRDARNEVAHTYSEARAMRVVQLAEPFAREAQYLLDRVKEKLRD
jgi:nucleotidyltransferase substrate binding protein (TIGR01987 family)